MKDWIRELPTYRENGTPEELRAHFEAVAEEGKRRIADGLDELSMAGYDVFYLLPKV